MTFRTLVSWHQYKLNFVHLSPAVEKRSFWFRKKMTLGNYCIHIGINPVKVSSNSGVNARLVCLCTAISPADNPIKHHPAIVLTDHGATGISLTMEREHIRAFSADGAFITGSL